jgi:transglutaminase-like putative cysteine protease
MRLDVGCQLGFQASAPTPLILMLKPQSSAIQQVIHTTCRFEPDILARESRDPYGNLRQLLLVPAGQFQAEIRALVDTADDIDVHPGSAFVPVQDLPDAVLQFLLPSRYCQSDQVGALANHIVAGILSAYDQVEAIRHWIHTAIAYRYETSDASTSALDTITNRSGVCRDFAHLGIALCRSLTIPARMVVGYLHELKPMDLHAWFEVYVGDRWYAFDATQSQPLGNRVVIAYGRDAADVAFAAQFGPLELMEMSVWVKPAELNELKVKN